MGLLAIAAALPAAAGPAGLVPGARLEIAHPAHGHEVHLSAPAVVADAAGPLVAWMAEEGTSNVVYAGRPGGPRVRVSPDGASADSLHLSPGLAVGPTGEIYATWSARKPKPAGVLFASDLYLSRSLDGGRTFDQHLRLNENRPLSHSFEGIAVAPDGTVLVAWIDNREAPQSPRTWLARVVDRGARVERTVRLDEGETCVCCRVDVAATGETVAVLWRKVFEGSVRDMVLGVSGDGGRTFAPPRLVNADGWKISACPHRGGQLATDTRGRIYPAWYTEGRNDRPRMLLAATADGQRFGAPVRLDTSAGSVPDQIRVAVGRGGQVVAAWEDATAVRRRVLTRYSTDGGRTFASARVQSGGIKAFAPALAVAPEGAFVLAWHEEQFPRLKTIVQLLAPAR